METPGPASVPPYPVEHPQRTGMHRQHRAVGGHGHLPGVDRRRVEAMTEDRRADTDIGLGADRNSRRLVAGRESAIAGIGLIRWRFAAGHSGDRAGFNARAARPGDGRSVTPRELAAAVWQGGHIRHRVDGGDARCQGGGDGRGSVTATPGAGIAATRGQEGGENERRGQGEPRPRARSQRPQGTTIQPGTTMEPASPRSTDGAQTHPEGEPQARIGSSRSHRNPPSPRRGPLRRQKTRPPAISCLEWASHLPLAAPRRPPNSTQALWDGSRGRQRFTYSDVVGVWTLCNALAIVRHPTRITASSFGPWAPRTRIRSMSPVRLGPVMKESMLGSRPECRCRSASKASARVAAT